MSGRTEPSRRQEKVARVIRESVSDTIANHLQLPEKFVLHMENMPYLSKDRKAASYQVAIPGLKPEKPQAAVW